MKRNNNYAHPQSLPRYLRLAKGLSQTVVAKDCGVATMDICRLERGNYGLHISKTCRIAEYLGVSVHALVNDDYASVPPQLDLANRDPSLRLRAEKRRADMKRVGDDGEAFVAAQERLRLQGTRYADLVNEAFADDPNAGFDIFSFTREGEPLYIEVKTTTKGKDETFFMSANEKAFMEACRREGRNYELHRVYKLNKKGVGKVVVYTLKDLENFDFQTETYSVRRKNK